VSKPGSTDGSTPERVKVLEVFRHPDPIGVHVLLYPGNQLSHVHLLRRMVGKPGGGVWGTRGERQQSNIFHVYLLRGWRGKGSGGLKNI